MSNLRSTSVVKARIRTRGHGASFFRFRGSMKGRGVLHHTDWEHSAYIYIIMYNMYIDIYYNIYIHIYTLYYELYMYIYMYMYILGNLRVQGPSVASEPRRGRHVQGRRRAAWLW